MADAGDRDARAGLRWTGLLAAGWLAAVLLVNPLGNFPLADDWSFGLAVRTLLTDHRLRLISVTQMTLITQILWGWLFCLPAGFSFTALRLSTLVAGLVGVGLVFRLARQLGLRPGPAALVAAAIAFNPLYFALSFSFMTDVPFTVLMVAAILAFVKAWQDGRSRWFWAGIALTALATLLRQLGLAVALAASLAEAIRARRVRSLAPLAAALTALLLWAVVLRSGPGLPSAYDGRLQQLFAQIRLGLAPVLWRVVITIGTGFVYTGLFTLPVQAVLPPASLTAPSRSAARAARAIALLAGVVSAATLIARRATMPLSGNILTNLTLFPVMMPGAASHPTAPLWVWQLTTAAGVVGGALLVERLIIGGVWIATNGTARHRPDPVVGTFLFGCAAWYMLPLLPLPAAGFYDRYLLPLIAVMALLTIWTASGTPAPPSRARWLGAGAILAGFALFAVPATHDTLALNRARWQAVHWAMDERGVAPDAIDGGFEVNNWYFFAGGGRSPLLDQIWIRPAHPQAIVSLAPVAGYRPVRQFPFGRWLPPGRASVALLVPQVPASDRR
ncbi:MAG: glycosyltransferase family 39 protein [Acidobacteriota bacterium]|nr:glycosyltransferase family 39 protein [Acidobacteriota bacterium]